MSVKHALQTCCRLGDVKAWQAQVQSTKNAGDGGFSCYSLDCLACHDSGPGGSLPLPTRGVAVSVVTQRLRRLQGLDVPAPARIIGRHTHLTDAFCPP